MLNWKMAIKSKKLPRNRAKIDMEGLQVLHPLLEETILDP